DLEHVVAHDPEHERPQCVRVAEPRERALCELATELLMAPLGVAGLRVVVQAAVRAAPRGPGLAEVVEARGETDRERVVALCRGRYDGERGHVDRDAVGEG